MRLREHAIFAMKATKVFVSSLGDFVNERKIAEDLAQAKGEEFGISILFECSTVLRSPVQAFLSKRGHDCSDWFIGTHNPFGDYGASVLNRRSSTDGPAQRSSQ
jgi:hypothetical protein